MQVNPKQSAIPQKPGPDLSQKGAAQNEVSQTRVQLGKKKMPPDPAMNNIMQADSHDVTMTLRRTYGMVISSYENHYYLPRFSLNENFGTSDRFEFAVNSFPLQIDQFSPEDMFLKNNKRPLIELTLVDDLNNNELNCYSNPGGNWN